MKKEIITEEEIIYQEKIKKLAKQCLTNTLSLDLIFRKGRYEINKPDLITKDESIGIAVIIGLTKRQLEIECCNIKRFYIATADMSKTTLVNNIFNKIIEKLQALNNNDFKKHFINQLFVYVSCFDEDIEEIMANIRNTEFHKYNFDTIYFLNNNHLHIYQNNLILYLIY